MLDREPPSVFGLVLIELLRPYGAKPLCEARGLLGVAIANGQEPTAISDNVFLYALF